MTSSLLEAAFAHHVWATITLIDACRTLTGPQLQQSVPGTRGPILETLRHIVEGDAGYLDILTHVDERTDRAVADLTSLRALMERNEQRWSSFFSTSPDPDEVVTEIDPNDGFRRDAPVGVRLAQALQHGSDHRSQICTVLTTLGIQPPSIDVWDFGVATGRTHETFPAANG